MWFRVVLSILLVLGIHGLGQGLRSFYWMDHFRSTDQYHGRYEYRARRKQITSYVTDQLTLLIGVVLFYWLLK
jgi:hypothetical protein